MSDSEEKTTTWFDTAKNVLWKVSEKVETPDFVVSAINSAKISITEATDTVESKASEIIDNIKDHAEIHTRPLQPYIAPVHAFRRQHPDFVVGASAFCVAFPSLFIRPRAIGALRAVIMGGVGGGMASFTLHYMSILDRQAKPPVK